MVRIMQFWLIVLIGTLQAFIQAPIQLFAQTKPYNQHFDVLNYTFRLALNDRNDEIQGEATIDVAFKTDGVKGFQLDLIGKIGKSPTASTSGMTVLSVKEGFKVVPFSQDSIHITIPIPTATKAQERRQYTVTYKGVPADGLIISKNKFGERTFFGDNWATRARHWLPTVDHPSDKATCEFLVTAPQHYQVIANGLLVEETDLDSANGDGMRLTHWRESVPIPTKVMVIGVARFAVQHLGDYRGKPLQSWVFPKDRVAGFYDYAQAVNILEFFERQIGEFAYEKLANVQSKTRFGGMENASAIFYSETALDGKRSNEGLLAHEIAHQWFGDAVSETDWCHIWLSESFATYFADVYLEYIYGRDRMVENMQRERGTVIRYARQHPAATIVDSTVKNLNELLNANSYQKGAWVLHMLRRVMGNDAFWNGIRAYYKQFKNGNAATEDFKRVMEEASGKDLTWFFREWLFQSGYPKLAGAWSYDSTSKSVKLSLRQTQEGLFDMPMDIGVYAEGGSPSVMKTVRLNQREQIILLPIESKPLSVIIDPNAWLLCEVELKKSEVSQK